jgi:hypothetical protein
VNLSAEQRTRIRNTVFASQNVPRVNNVNFAIRVGTVVPTSVRVVVVPAALIEIYPDWRSHSYFVVNEDIIIVDSGHRIVAMVPVGSGGGASLEQGGPSRAGAGSGRAGVASTEEIRQIQIALQQQGYDVEVDGILGPRTRQILIVFQRERGLPSTGQVDERTVAALGLSKHGTQGNQPGMQQPSTTGQGVPQSDRPPAERQPDQPPPASQDRNPQNRDGMGNQNRDDMRGNRSDQPMRQDAPR